MPEKLPAPGPGKMRFCLGLFLFVLSWLLPFAAFWIAASPLPLAIRGILIGLVSIGGPEIVALIAIAVLGKECFELLAARSLSFLKKLAPRGSVSRNRYRVGLVMFVLPIFPWYILAYAPQLLPDSLPSLPYFRLCICLASDLCFWSSLFVLGGDFWDKLRSLFIYEARAVIPDSVPNPGKSSI